MTQRVFTPTIATFENAPALQSCIDKWGPLYHPAAEGEEQGELVTVDNTTMKQQVDIARAAGIMKAGPYFYFKFTETGIERDVEDATHACVPMNNHPTAMEDEARALAAFEGVDYKHVSWAIDDWLKVQRTGEKV